MFAFYESDWFTIILEILFLVFIVYDIKRYIETKKREYLLNIVLTIGFFFWALVPFYNKYLTWHEADRATLVAACLQEHNESYCNCLDDKVFKSYSRDDFKSIDQKNDVDFVEFLDESDRECRGDLAWYEGWF